MAGTPAQERIVEHKFAQRSASEGRRAVAHLVKRKEPSSPPAEHRTRQWAQSSAWPQSASQKMHFQIDGHYFVELRFRRVENVGPGLDAGIVHEHVEPPEPLHRGVHQPLEFCDFADVGLNAWRLISKTSDLFSDLYRGLRVRNIVDHYVCTLFRELQNDRCTNAPISAGHDCDLVLERQETPRICISAC
jgi:hypothetical protein